MGSKKVVVMNSPFPLLVTFFIANQTVLVDSDLNLKGVLTNDPLAFVLTESNLVFICLCDLIIGFRTRHLVHISRLGLTRTVQNTSGGLL